VVPTLVSYLEDFGSDMLIREEVQQQISYAFKNAELLKRALTHKSFANENKVALHNERLEFLGDSVLNLIISEYLMKFCPSSSEGDLSRLRAAIVNEPALAEVARKIRLGTYLLLGKGEELTGGRNKNSLLADSLEALIAAVYLDAGIEATRSLTINLFEDMLHRHCREGAAPSDYKTKLQEYCQERLKQLPEYRVVSKTGPDHQKQFVVEVFLTGVMHGQGNGKSKKEAQQQAAKDALAKLCGDSPS